MSSHGGGDRTLTGQGPVDVVALGPLRGQLHDAQHCPLGHRRAPWRRCLPT